MEPSVAQQHEQELLRHYWDQLNECLRQQHLTVYTEEQLQTNADVAFLDYTRFLIGSMWGEVSPESCSRMAGDMNQGMHKRWGTVMPGSMPELYEVTKCARALHSSVKLTVCFRPAHLVAGLLSIL